MKSLEFDKAFFEKVFSEARMHPYFDRYPGAEEKAIRAKSSCEKIYVFTGSSCRTDKMPLESFET